ncbi:MAG: DEAD/DEAH box helicase [Chlamydiales bacterium]
MLNFRKLRQDFSSAILKEGKDLFDKAAVMGAKILHLDGNTLRLSSKIKGAFENVYESEIEINRTESMAVDSNCDCTYSYDCQHIAALLYYLEKNLNEIVVAYSQEADLEQDGNMDDEVKLELARTFKEAATKEDARKDLLYQKELLTEYVGAAKQLGSSPFFLHSSLPKEDKAELAIIFNLPSQQNPKEAKHPEIQLAIRLASRFKPLYLPNIKAFLDAVWYREPISISGRSYFFSINSFEMAHREILTLVINHARFYGGKEERYLRLAQIDTEAFGAILARAYDLALLDNFQRNVADQDLREMPCLYNGLLEQPLYFSTSPSQMQFTLEYLEAPGPKLLLKPTIRIGKNSVELTDLLLFESTKPGLLYDNIYYRFPPQIRRVHLQSLSELSEVTLPEPLFGTFIENSLPVMRQYAEVTNPSVVNRFITLPHVETIKGRCEISYLNNELEAKLFFIYGKEEIPAAFSQLQFQDVCHFMRNEGILARNLIEERKIIQEIFDDFLFDDKEGVFRLKSEKKIVEFMTERIPNNQNRVSFECPENLSEQFIYDESVFELYLRETEQIDTYEIDMKIDGYLKGTHLDLLWNCIAAKKRYLELQTPSQFQDKRKAKIPRILILDLEKIGPLVQIFDEMGIEKLDNCKQKRPIWSLAHLHGDQFKSLPVKFSMSKKLQQIQKHLIGNAEFVAEEIPSQIQATLRKYQVEGVQWLERLRSMHLNGILADDMGLGKTLQAITAITQLKQKNGSGYSLIVCPTSLVYNWMEEFHKFNPNLKILVVDAIPSQRRKLLKNVDQQDIVITSYNLLQKDIEIYKTLEFEYIILDEAQHIKNRVTRNAKSVKMIQAKHRLILTGTPIENSLEELWSLFDFLMPGLLSSYDRFVEKYIRNCGCMSDKTGNLKTLKQKVSPFILRRLKEDVLDDLPPVSEIVYHCHLTEKQKELYRSYAASAKEELSRLVKKEGYEKIQIHVLATLTRLKQICCHPAIFAKEKPENGDSAKYDMLMELLLSLIEGNHKTVIFSQYTKMLSIMHDELKSRGIAFSYLDGSSKNRMNIVKQFNEDPNILVFLVSLKAGGSGLNLVGADTIILYDMWWNPAVDNQARDRVHRIGQKKSVSLYKLITLNTIEEKILELQNRKKSLVKKVINTDDEVISKLTWEEFLELLQT